MEKGLQEEHVEYGISMLSPQLSQWAAPIWSVPLTLKCVSIIELRTHNSDNCLFNL